MNPIQHARDQAGLRRYYVEPYVVAADIGGVAPYVGRGGWTWHTGSAAWLWRFGVERILGVRPEQGGVRIEPCLPPHWRRASVTLKRASGTLAIAIENPDGVSTGIVECRVDGVAQEQAIVAFPTDGRERRVTIRLGRVAPGSSRAAEHVPAPDAAIV